MTDRGAHVLAYKTSLLPVIFLICFGAMAFCPTSSAAQADVGEENGSKGPPTEEVEIKSVVHPENTLPPWLYFSGLTVTCKITPESGTFTGTQTGSADGDKSILSVKLKNCRYETEEDGSGQLVADLEVDLSETADLQSCNSFSLAFLFDVESLTADFPWAGSRTLIESLEVQSIYGDVREIAFFELHDLRSGDARMRTFLEASGNYPGYVDLFWGRVVLLTSTGNEVQSLIEERLRELAAAQAINENSSVDPAEFNLEIGVRMYTPRGACADYPAVEDDPVDQHPIDFK
jgi:hypothetical protein